MKETGSVIALTFVAVMVFIAVVLTIAFAFESVRPVFLDLRREGNQASQQYVETTRGRLFDLKRNFDDLQADIDRLSADESNAQTVQGMAARQESILDEMEEEADSIPVSEVPDTVMELLKKKGRIE